MNLQDRPGILRFLLLIKVKRERKEGRDEKQLHFSRKRSKDLPIYSVSLTIPTGSLSGLQTRLSKRVTSRIVQKLFIMLFYFVR